MNDSYPESTLSASTPRPRQPLDMNMIETLQCAEQLHARVSRLRERICGVWPVPDETSSVDLPHIVADRWDTIAERTTRIINETHEHLTVIADRLFVNIEEPGSAAVNRR